MKSLFTIHAGEHLFGNEIESRFPKLITWIPSKDNGIDFLVTNAENKKPLTIQVKYSRDFNWSHGSKTLKPHIKSTAWYSLNRDKIIKSKADYWVFVNYDGFHRSSDFIFIKPAKLLQIFKALGRNGSRIESYLLVTNSDKCYETRDLSKKDFPKLFSGELKGTSRDLTSYLERWDIFEKHFK